MSRIGIVVALPQEAGMWTAARLRRGDLVELSPELRLAVSGVGGANAEKAARQLLAAGCDALVSWGTAGALSQDLRRGQLVVGKRIADADGNVLATDEAWAQRAARRLSPHAGVLVTDVASASHILGSMQDKQSLATLSGADIVDMESAALARIAAREGIPLLVLRAVVDELDATIPPSVIAATDTEGHVRMPRLLARLLIRPGEWASLLHMAHAFGQARRSLAQAAGLLGPDLALPKSQAES